MTYAICRRKIAKCCSFIGFMPPVPSSSSWQRPTSPSVRAIIDRPPNKPNPPLARPHTDALEIQGVAMLQEVPRRRSLRMPSRERHELYRKELTCPDPTISTALHDREMLEP